MRPRKKSKTTFRRSKRKVEELIDPSLTNFGARAGNKKVEKLN